MRTIGKLSKQSHLYFSPLKDLTRYISEFPAPYTLIISPDFALKYGRVIEDLRVFLLENSLPDAELAVLPLSDKNFPMPVNWSEEDRNRTIWLVRGAKSVGYVTI